MHGLLEKERIALCRANEESLYRLELGIGPEEHLQQLVNGLRGERLQPQMPVVGLSTPAMDELRPIVDKQQNSRGAQAVHENVEQRLRLGVDPVQVLEHQDERLH